MRGGRSFTSVSSNMSVQEVFPASLTDLVQNLRVIASYYSRITMSRLTELLDLPPLTTERTICKLVTDKTIYARIDRPAGIVSFKQKKGVNEVLNAWSGDIGKMLSLVEKTSHLVAKVSYESVSHGQHGADACRSTRCTRRAGARSQLWPQARRS
jgi:hypothetical protein